MLHYFTKKIFNAQKKLILPARSLPPVLFFRIAMRNDFLEIDRRKKTKFTTIDPIESAMFNSGQNLSTKE